MRKVTSNSISHFLNRMNFGESNTTVTNHYGNTEQNEPKFDCNTDFSRLILFGNTIAIYTVDERLFITNGGFFTATTKERLNGLGEFGKKVNIKQKSGEWHLNGNVWDGKWKEIF